MDDGKSKHGTAIEWTHRAGTKGETWNPIRARNKATGAVGHFCEHVTDACKFCYAEAWQFRLGTNIPFKPGHRKDVDIYLDEKTLLKPIHWKTPRTIFVCSMTDLFGEWVTDEWLDRIYAAMAICKQHTFIVLTKRPERMLSYLEGLEAKASIGHLRKVIRANGWPEPSLLSWPLQNVWGGTSVCDQADADRFIPPLLAAPLAVRFVSYEPALAYIDFERIKNGGDIIHALSGRVDELDGDGCYNRAWRKLNQVICGGESGRNARPMHPDWARSVRDQCRAASVAFFFKQWGSWAPAEDINPSRGDGMYIDDNGGMMTMPIGGGYDRAGINLAGMRRMDKRVAGHMLDGVAYQEFPVTA